MATRPVGEFKVRRIPRWLRVVSGVVCVIGPIAFLDGDRRAAIAMLAAEGFALLDAIGQRQNRR